jgi:Domain of unknown function (DUF4157)
MTGSPSQPLEQDTWTPINSHLGHDFSQIPLFAEARTEDMHQLAKKGIVGNAGPLPYLDQIQQSFGPRHDLSRVKAYVGSEAAVAARRMAAEAYATGDQVAFAVVPNLQVAAHEAAHVIQQRKGIQLKDGVGESGDPHEQHADAVADTVVRGVSAESLLDRMAQTSAGHAGLPSVQRQGVMVGMGDTREMWRGVDREAEALIKQYRSDPPA